MSAFDLGKAQLTPRGPVVAGSYVTLTYTYTVGHPVDDSGYVMIAFRQVGDFGPPQFADPAAPNYCSVQTTGDCRILPRWDPKGHRRPWSKALYLQVRFGFLDADEKVIVTFGDTSGGSPGWQMQTFCERTFEFKTLVDPIATFEFKELPRSPDVRIVPGEPVRAVCIAPSQVRLGRKFHYHLKLEDQWGNPTGRPKRLTHPGFSDPGVHAIEARDEVTGLPAVSNPIEVLADAPLVSRYWADFHGQSEETIGSNTIDDYYTFARDYARLDICAHQGNDFQVTDAFWDKVNETARRFYKPGKFVTFPGYEWSGNTPLGGDRNVYFKSEGGSISRSCRDLLPGGESSYPDSPTAADLFRNLNGPGPFAFAHAGGRYADVRMHDPKVEVAMEVHSAWGTFEWLVEDALSLGYRIGICANSDGHKTRPGASYPGASTFGSLGGLTCVLAESLDRDCVHAAIMARHFYATTGNRLLLDVSLDAGRDGPTVMGDVVEVGERTPTLHVRAVGTAPIESVEVRNGLNVVRTVRPFAKADLGRRVKLVWSGAEVRGRNRLVRWDGSLIVRGNRILAYQPINFWNPTQQPSRPSRNRLEWRSVTTGGLAGLILDLERAGTGTIEIDTVQCHLKRRIAGIGLKPWARKVGGLGKQIQVYRLPDEQPSAEFSFSLPLRKLHAGDNPIYVCVRQEDGHMAWSSPIYVVR